MKSITKIEGERVRKVRQVYTALQESSVVLVNLQRKLSDAGLFLTMHKVNEASQQLGWEAAEILKKLKAKLPQ